MPLKSKGDYHTVIIREIWAAYNIINAVSWYNFKNILISFFMGK